jgi:DNA primase
MIGTLLNRLEKVKGTKGRWTACCPAHGDKSPSLAIRQLDDGRILLKCFAGCSAYEVVSAVGMDMQDLFPSENKLGYTSETQSQKSERRPFYAADLMKIIQFEAVLTSLAAFDLSEGRQISTDDRKRLKTAVSRINEAVSYIQ